MAEAYAALMSLMNTSEMILHPSQQWLRIHRNMIESLLKKVRFLQEFLEDYSHRGHQEMAGLERQVADMAHGAEDVIESHVLDQILARSTGSEAKSSTSFSQYIHKVIEEMEDLIENKLKRIKETIGKFAADRTFIDSSPAVPSRSAPNTMVGSDEKLEEILDILTGQQSNRQIVAIVGMGGIGKTTLAKNVYEHPLIKHHFDIRAWATISQKHSARKIISEMLSEIGQSLSDDLLGQQFHKSKGKKILSDEMLGEQNTFELGEKLYKSLCGRRYLIVMDDFWSIEAWDEIKRFFPDDRKGSRIMITTRLGNVAAHLRSCRTFEMDFLDADTSWELLGEKVFGRQGCPPELDKLGKTIAKNCGGLPLAIVVIGGLLAKSDKTTVFWEHVVENLSSIINSEDKEKCLEILYLSYNNLPIHLKPCFLYLAIAQERSKIHVHPVVNALVSEGFLKPIRGISLEEAANEYITDLIDRNLIFVRNRGFLGELETCGIHDLLKDLCLREASKINLCGVIDVQNPHIPSEIKLMRGIGFRHAPLKPERQIPCGLELVGQASLTRSIISGSDSTLWLRCATNLRLLRLLLVTTDRNLEMTCTTFPNDILRLINLRLISFDREFDGNSILKFTSSISLFWNLQTFGLDVDSLVFLPPEIWCLPHLRHLECSRCVLPDPPADSHILENLQTLTTVVNFRWCEEACSRLPNLKILIVMYDSLHQGVEYWTFFHNLVHLQKLQSLKFYTKSPISWEYLSFPLSLKKLTLRGCRLPWEDMSIVGSLPNLELLRLRFDACKGLTWCPIQGHFVKLKVLLIIGKIDLLHWRADKTHFPIIEHLILEKLNLLEFPQDFGEHPTLAKIDVLDCSDSTKAWAEEVGEEQNSFGNEGFRVIIE